MSLPIRSAPAERNKGPILEVLVRVLPAAGHVLEVASGTGQHVRHFAAALPALTWQPSEAAPERVTSLEAFLAAAPLPNIAVPRLLDVERTPWPVEAGIDALLCINMIHIAPWSATVALLDGAGRLLRAAGVLVLYGPYLEGDRHTAPSNEAFDRSLRARDHRWGVRDLGAVSALAAERGLLRTHLERLPANNLCVVFARAPG